MMLLGKGIAGYALLAVFITILFTSCATLIHRKSVEVNVHSDSHPVKICMSNDTTAWYDTPVLIQVDRSENDLILIARKDSVQKQFEIKNRLSTAFWIGNLFSGIGIFGYAIDLYSPKRFTYPSYISLDFNDNKRFSKRNYRTWVSPEKGLLSFKISIPEGNHFYLNKGQVYVNTFGFLGISGGFEYYFSDKYCLNMDMGALLDFMVPFPAPVDYEGSYQMSNAIFGDIQLGSDFWRLHYDLGLQFNRTSYYNWGLDSLKYSQKQNNIGFALSAYYRISNGFNLGINYYPSLIAWNASGFGMNYSHLIFFELNFRIEAIRPGKEKQKLTNLWSSQL